ncbi:MAG: hypothetical protein PHF26_04825, partial [Candidatus Gracilibacteria bacterium]|nr:hypothetical protein [Candidatus Gracilibacteria bacterium]
LPVSSGLHPYFKVKTEDKKQIEFLLNWNNKVETDFESRSIGGTDSINNPGSFQVFMPGIGKLQFAYSGLYKKVWIRSEEGKDFVCIEPVMNNKGGLIDNPQIIKPGENLVLENSISLI